MDRRTLPVIILLSILLDYISSDPAAKGYWAFMGLLSIILIVTYDKKYK